MIARGTLNRMTTRPAGFESFQLDQFLLCSGVCMGSKASKPPLQDENVVHVVHTTTKKQDPALEELKNVKRVRNPKIVTPTHCLPMQSLPLPLPEPLSHARYSLSLPQSGYPPTEAFWLPSCPHTKPTSSLLLFSSRRPS